MAAYTPDAKLRFVPNPLTTLPPEQPDDELRALHGTPFMLMVGRLHEQKAYDVALHAVARIKQEREPWPLLIAGTGRGCGPRAARRTPRGRGARALARLP